MDTGSLYDNNATLVNIITVRNKENLLCSKTAARQPVYQFQKFMFERKERFRLRQICSRLKAKYYHELNQTNDAAFQ